MKVATRRPALLACLLALACAATTPRTSTAPTAGSAAAPAPPGRALPDSGADSELAAIATRLDRLATELAAFWRSKGPDRTHGGFHATLDRSGAPIPPTDKGLVQQARHLWTFSTLYQRRGQNPEDAAIAHDLYRFLIAHFRSPASGDFVFRVDAAGRVIEPRFVLYAESFAIYALVRYGAAFDHAEAIEIALTCFRAMDRRRHDPTYGGYDERDDTPWLREGSAKSTNTHLHLIEAFAALYELTRDPLVLARTSELLDLFTTRIVQQDGHAQPEFDQAWRPLGAPEVSYGHDLESSWLLHEVASTIGRRSEPAVDRTIRQLGETSAAWGYDAQAGGYFETGVPGGAVTTREKIWWIQFEALPALWQLFRVSGDERYLQQLTATLRWIETRQRDAQFGELYWGVLPDGQLGAKGDRKGEEWKAGYHQLRALIFVADWMKQHASRRAARAAALARAQK